MERLTSVLKKLATNYPLENNFNWKIPVDCPLKFPDMVFDEYERNIYLKHHMKDLLLSGSSLKEKYWIIQEWGGIRSFKSSQKNDLILENLESELHCSKLKRETFEVISSVSKVASFLDHDKYAIYDSRVIYSLNWLLFQYTDEVSLYPQPSGRNAELSRFDLATLFNLSDKNVVYKSYKTAYFDYCSLMEELSKAVYKKPEPYHVEMLLFIIATKYIIDDIPASIMITMKNL